MKPGGRHNMPPYVTSGPDEPSASTGPGPVATVATTTGFLTTEATNEKLVVVEVTMTTWTDVGTFENNLE